MKKFLVIQTAFIGDVILATGVIEKLHQFYPDAQIDFLVRQGNESLLAGHPFINKTLVWMKKQHKYKNLFKLAQQVRQAKYDYVINLQRHAGSGFITWRSGAKHKIGFDKNPLSLFYTQKFPHQIGNGQHEVERNQQLIAALTDQDYCKPKLYPSTKNYDTVSALKLNEQYIVIAPASVWFTKQLPKQKVIELIDKQDENLQICLIGAPTDIDYCNEIIDEVNHKKVMNLCGELNLLDSAVLIENAQMNFVNDSAPLHIASAMNTNVTAFFCSTIPDFGFGPLSTNTTIKQVSKKLDCRPCGMHGHKECPKGHFKCGFEIEL